MRKAKIWRVRVKRSVEEWVDIKADSKEQAEQEAASVPNILSVLTGMTIRGDRPLEGMTPPIGVEEDEDDY